MCMKTAPPKPKPLQMCRCMADYATMTPMVNPVAKSSHQFPPSELFGGSQSPAVMVGRRASDIARNLLDVAELPPPGYRLELTVAVSHVKEAA